MIEPEFSLLYQTTVLQKQFSANEESSVVLQTQAEGKHLFLNRR